MSKRAGETTIRTSIRIRPCSEKEKEAWPGPSPVQPAPGEVRLYQKQFLPGSGRNSPNLLRSPRSGTPTSPRVGPSNPSMVWRQAAQNQLSNEYQSYAFANVFGPGDGNEEVYNGSGCRDVVAAVLGGCNGTIFVYGQTGAGKTHTMDAMTDKVLQQLYAAAAADDSSSEVAISVCAVELYNEVLRCLLSGRENLQLRLTPGAGSVAGVVLEGAEERPCGSIEEAAAIVTMAKASRAVGETRANARSSRSHLIVRIKVEVLQLSSLSETPRSPAAHKGEAAAGAVSSPRGSISSRSGSPKKQKPPPAMVTFSTLNLVDLAGSERIDKTGSSDTPLRLREALNINKSLLCLGNVVNALAERTEGKRGHHIPYRDSKLTRLLEDSLGGTATTALVACITQLPEWHLEQTRNTLEFAARAARVVCKPQRNVVNLMPSGPSPEAASTIAALQAEVEALKKQLERQVQQAKQEEEQQRQLVYTIPTLPVNSSNALWDSCSSHNGTTRCHRISEAAASAQAALAAEHTASGGLSRPSSPSNNGSSSSRGTSLLRMRTGCWANRLRMSFGGAVCALSDLSVGMSSEHESATSPAQSPQSHYQTEESKPGHALGAGSATISAAAGAAHAAAPAPAAIQSHPAQPAAAAVPSMGSTGCLPASAHTTSIISRTSDGRRSLLWKLLQQQQQQPSDRQRPTFSSDGFNSGFAVTGLSRPHSHSSHSHSSHATAQSLRSTGLLITSSGNAATAAAAVAANAVGMLARWATFSGGRLSSTASNSAAVAAALAGATHDGSSNSGHHNEFQQHQHHHGGRHSVVSRSSAILSRRLSDSISNGGGLTASAGGGSSNGGCCLLDSAHAAEPSLENQLAAAEAAMALRDHIIKQLVTALQQKKAEIRALKEQLAAVMKQLEQSEGEEEASKAKLRELAEGIQMLAAARQEEFEKWKGHLVGLESALQSAQQEAMTYRSDSQALLEKLAQLQARYDSLQTEQRNSLIAASPRHRVHSCAPELEDDQFAACLKSLLAIESALQKILLGQSACRPLTGPGPYPGSTLSRSTSMMQQLLQQGHQADAADTAAAAAEAAAALDKRKPGEISSHQIQTVSTRVFDTNSHLLSTGSSLNGLKRPGGISSLADAAGEAASAAKLAHIEFVLAELQGLMPLVKAAAAAATAASAASAAANAAAAAAASPRGQAASIMHTLSTMGSFHRLSTVHSGDGSSGGQQEQQQQQQQEEEEKGGQHGAEAKGPLPKGPAHQPGIVSVSAGKCHKCDSLKPLLVIMQKLKDEVVLLKAAVRTRDSQLAAAEDSAAGMKRDLQESRQQAGSLRERIDELSEDLELARSAAAAATAAAATAAAAASSSNAGSNAAASGSYGCKQGLQVVIPKDRSGQVSPACNQAEQTPSPGGRLSRRESIAGKQVPLMSEDTPLEALHEQILQSWHALAMPLAYRSAFVLGSCCSSSSGSQGAAGNGAASNAAGSTETPSSSAAAAAGADASADAALAAAAAGVCRSPWQDRGQCQAHVALLACLHQYHEDEPAAAAQQQDVLVQEAQVVGAGLANLQPGELQELLQQWGIIPEADAAARRAALLAKLWAPCAAVAADRHAAASAAACQLALRAAPAADLAAVSLCCNASVLAAASNALAEAAS